MRAFPFFTGVCYLLKIYCSNVQVHAASRSRYISCATPPSKRIYIFRCVYGLGHIFEAVVIGAVVRKPRGTADDMTHKEEEKKKKKIIKWAVYSFCILINGPKIGKSISCSSISRIHARRPQRITPHSLVQYTLAIFFTGVVPLWLPISFFLTLSLDILSIHLRLKYDFFSLTFFSQQHITLIGFSLRFEMRKKNHLSVISSVASARTSQKKIGYQVWVATLSTRTHKVIRSCSSRLWHKVKNNKGVSDSRWRGKYQVKLWTKMCYPDSDMRPTNRHACDFWQILNHCTASFFNLFLKFLESQ